MLCLPPTLVLGLRHVNMLLIVNIQTVTQPVGGRAQGVGVAGVHLSPGGLELPVLLV